MGRKRLYFTEEERKAARREANRKYYQTNKEKFAEYQAEYYQNNKEKIAEWHAEWRKNNKDKIAERTADYYQNNKEKYADYYQNNKEKFAEYMSEYQATPKGRANMLLNNYKFSDKTYNRGECTLTADWIVEHIFSQPCHYCGKTDWKELGCDRIDNSLPHTQDNVVPCCTECNAKKARYSYDEYMKMIGKIV